MDYFAEFFSWLNKAWTGMSTSDQLKGILQLSGGILALGIAYFGLRTWRLQIYGSLEAERSLAFIDAIWDYAHTTRSLCFLMIDMGELDQYPAEHRERQKEWFIMQYQERTDKVVAAQQCFNKEWGHVQALWGTRVFGESVEKISAMCATIMSEAQIAMSAGDLKKAVQSLRVKVWWRELEMVIEETRFQLKDVLPKRRFKFKGKKEFLDLRSK